MKQLNTSYFNTRCKALGITTEEAISDHSLSIDAFGNIVQKIRHFDGSPFMFLPKFGNNAKQYKKHKQNENRKSTFVLQTDESDYYEQLSTTRHTPTYLKKNPKLGKYKYQSKKYTGHPPKAMPTKLVIDNYNNRVEGGTLVFTEGYFKAIALSANGIEATAFSSITTFKLDASVKEYLTTRKPKDLVLLYDGDTQDISKNSKDISDKRPRNFYNSAYKFTKQLYQFCKEENLDIKLHWCMSTSGAKGIDDILEVHNKEFVVEQFNTLKTSSLFDFMTLPKSNYKKKLQNKILFNNHHDFFQHHKEQIRKQPFTFNGITYQSTTIQTDTKTFQYFKVVNNPFLIQLKEVNVDVYKYLDEARNEIEPILKHNKFVALDALTGCGKTAFYTGYFDEKKWINGYFERNKMQGVITLPYQSNVKQLKEELRGNGSFGFLVGEMSYNEKIHELNNNVIICTYDHLQNIPNLDNSTLVIDEAHNLVNQIGFRSKTLRNVLNRFDDASNVVLISGTPPRLLCDYFNFKYVKVNRKINNIVNLNHLECNNVQEGVLASLAKCNNRDENIRCVFYNSIEGAETLKASLVHMGIYQEKEVDIITRSYIDNNLTSTYDSIINNEQIKEGIKLVICTCLLSEGINIKNTNIAEVFMVQVNCIDTFRQFVARFRNMKTLNIYSIRKERTHTLDSFKMSINDSIRYNIESAKLQKNLIQLEYNKEVKQGIEYDYTSNTYEFVYMDGEEAKVDYLKLFYDEKQRMQLGMNDDYFYTILNSFDNINLVGYGYSSENNEAKEILNEIYENNQETKEAVLNSLLVDVINIPHVVIHALKHHYDTSNDKNYSTLMSNYTKDIKEMPEAEILEYYTLHKEHFKLKLFRTAIRQFIRMYFVNHSEAHEAILMNEKQFMKVWNKIKWVASELVYQNKNTRLKLNPIHRRTIKDKRKLKYILSNETNSLTIEELMDIVRASSIYRAYNNNYEVIIHKPIKWTRTKTNNLLHELFNIEKEGNYYKITKYDSSNFAKLTNDKALITITI